MEQKPLVRKQITVGAEVFELRPNFACYCAIEEKTGESLLLTIRKFSKGDIRLNDVVAVLWGGLVGTQEETGQPIKITFKELGEKVWKQNWTKNHKVIVEFASQCLVGYADAVPAEAEHQAKEEKKIPESPTPLT